MSTKLTPPSPKAVRLTISVTPEVHATFQRMADVSGMSLGRCMGDWLADTMDAAEYTANLMEKARAAPKLVARELHGYAMGLADETGALLGKLAARGRAGSGEQSETGPGRPFPPPSNTGGKVPSAGKRQGPRKAQP